MHNTSLVFGAKCLSVPISNTTTSTSSSTTLLPPARLHRIHSTNSIAFLLQRRRRCTRPHIVNNEITRTRYSTEPNELLPCSQLPDRSRGVSCFHSFKRKHIGVIRFASGFFVDKSNLHLLKPAPANAKVKNVLVRCASMPGEPRAAGTTWPDVVTEKQGLDSLDLEVERVAFERFLESDVPSHPKLHRGQLDNGFRYVILLNKDPPNRFEAHMEVHVGSLDEEEDEQGIAHMIEHVAFVGSKKRQKLLGTGASSDAYTDFHHTVFHTHSPTSTKESDLLPAVLDAMNEIAFHPEFLASRVEKERQAILSEVQMMNTIEYRVDCQLLQYLHSENKLSKRFPIGLEEQIKKWNADKLRKFHERWYFPANATLYIVGDIDNIPRTVKHIEAIFGQTGRENEILAAPRQSPNLGLANGLSPERSSGLMQQTNSLRKERHSIRPPVQHNWSIPGSHKDAKPPQIFQHELLQNFLFNMFCKIPVKKLRTYSDIRNMLMKRILLSALQFRINTRYKNSNPLFTSVEMDQSDSGREGCTVTTLTVTAEPQNWQSAIKVAVQEVRKLKEFGVTNSELTRYLDELVKDSEQLAAMIDNVSSGDILNFIMENDALGHTVMDHKQGHECLVAIAGTITLKEVNAIGAEVLEFIADFGKPSAPLPAAIVACVPKNVQIDGIGESTFRIEPEEILSAIEAGLKEHIEAEPELEIPKELISSEHLQVLKMQRRPCFIPVDQDKQVTRVYDEETGIVKQRLSNGIPVNYKISKNEANCGVMRLVVGGGRAAETFEEKEALIIGVRTLKEGGRVAKFSREQVELFCMHHLIGFSLESTEEFIFMEFQFTLRDNGMCAAFQLLHMVLEHSVWSDDAFNRVKQSYLSYYQSIPKSLEHSTARKLKFAILNGDERFFESTPNSVQLLSLEQVKDAVMSQFVSDNMEVSIVGVFSEEDIEFCILEYLGTVRKRRGSGRSISYSPTLTGNLHNQQVFLKDTDERACAYIAGPAPNRWGFTSQGNNLLETVNDATQLVCSPGDVQCSDEHSGGMENVKKDLQAGLRTHPLFFSITMGLLAKIMKSRLLVTVRDSLGLTYDVSFKLNLYDRLNLGWYVISVTSTPGKVHKAVDACKNVLRGLHSNKISPGELDRAKRLMLMSHEAQIKSNGYWIRLMAHLQATSVPRKDISCIRDLKSLYESATIEYVYLAYEQLKMDENSLFSCIGIAGPHAGENVVGEPYS